MAHEEQQGRWYQEMQSITAALVCLALVYLLMPRLPRGLPRLLILLPCLPIFTWVSFSTRPHTVRAVLCFMLLWICPSKLLLLCWEDLPRPRRRRGCRGFLFFIATVVLPIRVKEGIPSHVKGGKPTSAHSRKGALLLRLLQLLSFLAVLNVIQYRESLSDRTIHALYCLLIYTGLESVLGLLAELATVLLGIETYPLFDKPFLASSLSDFWGHRWNLVATYMLRETVYNPILRLLSKERPQDTPNHTSSVETSKQNPALASDAITSEAKTSTITSQNASMDAGTPKENAKTICTSSKSMRAGGMQDNSISNRAISRQESYVDERKKESRYTRRHPLHARGIAMLSSFLASGLLHELIFCCINQSSATWEVTTFFVLHGFATLLEVYLRRQFPMCQKIPRPVAIFCTLGFISVSTAWLFMPPITRAGSDMRIIAEFNHIQNVITDLLRSH